MSELQNKIISHLGIKSKRIDRSTYELNNKVILFFRYSTAHEYGYNQGYWFGFSRDKFNEIKQKISFICFICGNESQVIVISSANMESFLKNVNTASDNNWKMTIIKNKGIYELNLTGTRHIDITKYLNDFSKIKSIVDFNSEVEVTDKDIVKIKYEHTEISIEDQINSLDGVDGDTLHNRLIDMLRQIGSWMNYKTEIEYRFRDDSPYRIDVAWLLNDAIHIAIEVQISGNITEAKDRLIHAKRFGARKCIIISNPESVDRIKNLFRYESEIKHWVEIWGIERVYNMFVDGRSFFENFDDFNKHIYREEIIEII